MKRGRKPTTEVAFFTAFAQLEKRGVALRDMTPRLVYRTLYATGEPHHSFTHLMHQYRYLYKKEKGDK